MAASGAEAPDGHINGRPQFWTAADEADEAQQVQGFDQRQGRRRLRFGRLDRAHEDPVARIDVSIGVEQDMGGRDRSLEGAAGVRISAVGSTKNPGMAASPPAVPAPT